MPDFNVLFKVLNIFRDFLKLCKFTRFYQPIGFSQCPNFNQEFLSNQSINVENDNFMYST